MAAAPVFNRTTFNEADTPLDELLLGETFLGSHCHPDTQFARLGLNRHEACVGWWRTREVGDRSVGFRCSCSCHDVATTDAAW